MVDPTQMPWFRAIANLPAQFDSLTWLDYTFLIMALIGILVGKRKGFAAMFGHLFLLIIAATITHYFTGPIAESFPFESPIARMLMKALTFASIAILSLFVIGIGFKIIGKVLQFRFSEFLEQLFGSIMGCAYFILLFSFLSNFALIFPGDWLHKTYEEKAPVGKFLMKLSPSVEVRIVEMLPREWRGMKIDAAKS